MGLTDKVAVVSGGSRGIGKDIVLALARMGARVAFIYHQNREAAIQIEEESKDLPGEVKAFGIDIRNQEQVKSFINDVVKKWGTLDIIVNNAGICRDKTLAFMNLDEWNQVLDTNITGTFYLTQAAIYHLLKKKSGRIINISSISGINGIAGQTNYSATKAALIGFTRSLAKEVAGYGICVNAVAPGGVQTDMIERMNEKQKQGLLDSIPLKRFCQPEEIARVVVFLADNEMSPDYLTGTVICVDGGMGI